MKIFSIIKQSFKAIFANKARSFLTILGIVIGIAAVISLNALGEGVKGSISDSFSSLGTDIVTINSSSVEEITQSEPDPMNTNTSGALIPGVTSGSGMGGGMRKFSTAEPVLTKQNFLDIQTELDDEIIAISPSFSETVEITKEDKTAIINITGVSEDYATIQDMTITQGSNFTTDNINDSSNTMIIGNTILVENEYEVGDIVSLYETDFEIIGILDEKEASRFQDPNKAVYIPYTTLMELSGSEYLKDITIKVVDDENLEQFTNDLYTTLDTSRETQEGTRDYAITSSEDILSSKSSVADTFTGMLTGIAAISLIVGGIGIMNIMLVSVTERTREIGLRKAVGARNFDIMIQFVIEAITLTTIGGILGVLAGMSIGDKLSELIGVAAVYNSQSILLAVLVSAGVGLIFGIFPAFKAAKMDPIVALRWE